MPSTVSNALLPLAQTSRPAPEGGISPLLMVTASLGVFVLAGYCIYRWARPGKLRLANAPRRHSRLTALYMCMFFAPWLVVISMTPAAVGQWMPTDDPRSAILASLAVQCLQLPLAIGAAWLAFPMGLSRGMGLSARHWFLDGLRAVVAFLAVLPVCLALWWLTTLVLGGQEHPILKALRHVGAAWQILATLSAVVMAPLMEEIVFRGLLQSMFRNYFTNPWPGIVFSSAAFAALHDPSSWPAIFALGVVLGYNYERTGRLLAPILIHALFNTVNTASMMLYGM
jgi:membrane protease YdiL (CAAX protease family)